MTRFGPYARLAGFKSGEQTRPASQTPAEEREETEPEPQNESTGFGLAAVKNILSQYGPTVKRRP